MWLSSFSICEDERIFKDLGDGKINFSTEVSTGSPYKNRRNVYRKTNDVY